MNRDSAILVGIVNEITDQRLDIAIEDQPDDVPIPIDNRRAGVSSDDVVRGNKIERSGKIQLVFFNGNYARYYQPYMRSLTRTNDELPSWSRNYECTECIKVVTARGQQGG